MHGRQLRTGFLLSASCLAVYLLQGRQALHGYDAFLALEAAKSGKGDAAGHLLYFPLARAWWALTRHLGLDVHAALRSLSAVAVAIGVFFAHRTALALRLRPLSAAGLAAAFGFLPVAHYVAAVVEVDGLLLGMSGIVWHSVVRLGRLPLPRRAVCTGLMTGLGACLHGGGQLLLAASCGLFLGWSAQRALRLAQWRPFWRGCGLAALVTAVHVGVYVLCALLSAHEGQLVMASNTLGLPQPWARLPTTLWREWLLPYAPFCVLWIGGFRSPHLRVLTACFAVCLLVYLWITNAVMGYFEPLGPELRERGSFMVGIALPTVTLAWLWLAPWARIVALALAAAIAMVDVHTLDWEPMPQGYATGLLQLASHEKFELWVSGFEREFGWLRKNAPEVRAYSVLGIPRELALREQGGAAVGQDLVDLWFDLRYAALQREGVEQWITHDALACMHESADPRIRQLADGHLPTHYAMEPVVQGTFRALRLRHL